MNDELIIWLLNGSPWIEYRTRIDLLGQTKNAPEVIQAYHKSFALPQIQNLISELSEWPGPILKSHKKAGHFLHKLGFLAELGFRANEPGIKKIAQRILEHTSDEGPFQVMVNIKPGYGGTGEDQLAWMLCDAPLVTYALVKFGLNDYPAIQDSLGHLGSLQRASGWPCAVSPDVGKFRGPGHKADPCPYANLLMLKLLAQFPEKHSDPVVKIGVETLLSLWDQRKERRPYLFAMGTDFTKLKAPLIWYDILHVTDVLSQITWALEDKRLQEMIEIVEKKAGQDGKFTAESIWMDWKTWEFGQKKEPSRWITLVAERMLKRSMTH
ncbi:MAG: hypothetical protein MUO54_09470 [Anaerolineales bacterium]|nr:hypothetical protein [Anaerolineales bacterium]